MAFLHEGLPRPTKDAHWEKQISASVPPPPRENYNGVLRKILSLPNVASKEWIIRQYDHEVQGGSVLKPLVGAGEDAPGDASVVRPVLDSRKGVVISCGMNPLLGDLDPYQSALHAIDEALRNAVAVGGNLARTAILDNFCWGNCNKPDRMGSLVQSAKACYDAAIAYSTPFVSGKDSLNNEFVTDRGQTIAIPPTLLISAISVIDDVRQMRVIRRQAGGRLRLHPRAHRAGTGRQPLPAGRRLAKRQRRAAGGPANQPPRHGSSPIGHRGRRGPCLPRSFRGRPCRCGGRDGLRRRARPRPQHRRHAGQGDGGSIRNAPRFLASRRDVSSSRLHPRATTTSSASSRIAPSARGA